VSVPQTLMAKVERGPSHRSGAPAYHATGLRIRELPIRLEKLLGAIHGFALGRMARMRRLGLKVLYITGFDVPAVEDGPDVLRKPISNEQLVDAVRLALANGNATRPK
jgi:hypothetical protein